MTDDRARACAEALEKLHPLLDGELTPEEARLVVAHLEACPPCGVEEDVYRRLKEAVAACGNGLDPAVVERLRAFADRLAERAAPDD